MNPAHHEQAATETPARILFAGTPDFSVPALRALIDAGYRIPAVYTQPDRPAGRGRQPTASPVKRAALEAGIPIRQPETLKTIQAQRELAAWNADLMIVVAYGLLLPQAVLNAPRQGCVNIHASLLPRWRGAAPIQRAIQAGDAETGISIMRMEAGLDTGPVYLIRKTPIREQDTGGSLHDRLSALGAEALIEALPGILDARLSAQPQDDAQANYARKLDKSEALIDWQAPATTIARQIRAFNPWPVAQTPLEDQMLRIWEAQALSRDQGSLFEAVSPAGAQPGEVLNTNSQGIDVLTGEGLLRITRLQAPGKRALTAAEFLNARPLQGRHLG